MHSVLQVQNLKKIYDMGEIKVTALAGVTLTLYEGEFVVILGPSGSGKSTLVNIIGGIDQPSGGQVLYCNQDISGFSEKQLTAYRRTAIGFIFQFYNLIPNLTAAENIQIAADLSEHPIAPAELLEKIGLSDKGGHFPSQLSGGQQQRVAIARAIAKNPGLLLCDEPTGALDFSTGIQVLRLLKDFNQDYHKTIVVITHNVAIGKMADRVIYMKDGLIDREEHNVSPIQPEEVVW